MAPVTKEDTATMLWMPHIVGEGSAAIRDRLLALQPGQRIRLKVSGTEGDWAKAASDKDGRPTDAVVPADGEDDVLLAWRKTPRHMPVGISVV